MSIIYIRKFKMLNIFQRFFLFFIFLNTIFSASAMQNEQDEKITQFSKIVESFLKVGTVIYENTDNTIFHSLAKNVKSPKDIRYAIYSMHTILPCARPPQDWTQTIKIAFWVLRYQLGKHNLPKDVIRLIFSQLPEDHFEKSSGLLYKIVYSNDYQKYYTIQIENHIKWIHKILQKTNNKGKTACQILCYTTKLKMNEFTRRNLNEEKNDYLRQLEHLLTGAQLIKDYNVLKENPNWLNPDYSAKSPEEAEKWGQNLVYQMINQKRLN